MPETDKPTIPAVEDLTKTFGSEYKYASVIRLEGT